jgi:hypothetical protein
VSGDVSAVAEWEYGTIDDISYHRVYKQDQLVFGEINDRAEWGNLVGFPT